MDANEIASAKGAEVYLFDFSHADVADTFTFTARQWTPYFADSNIVVGETISTNGNAATILFSVPLSHLAAYTSAHVEWEATAGTTVSYSLDGGTTWTLLEEHSAIALDQASNPDLDFSVGLGATDSLTYLIVRVLRSDTLYSSTKAHTATFSADMLDGDSILLTSGMLDLAPNADDTPQTYGSIEMWAQINSGGRFVDNTAFSVDEGSSALTFTGCTVYIDGEEVTSGAAITGAVHHIVIVPTTATNAETRIAQALDGTASMDLTLTHLALYPNALTAGEVTDLYAAQAALPVLSVLDTGAIGVTEYSPAVDIYAYPWSIVTGSVG